MAGAAPAAAKAGGLKAKLAGLVHGHMGVKLGALGAGGVVALALYRKREAGKSSTGSQSGVVSTATGTDAANASGSTSGTPDGYDSTESDLYDAFEPQFEQLQTQVNALATGVAGANPTTAPKAAAPAAAKTAPAKTTAPAKKIPARTLNRGTKPAAPAPTGTTYTVKSGDNLTSIARKLGVTEPALYAANKGVIGSNPNLIKPGQVLKK